MRLLMKKWILAVSALLAMPCGLTVMGAAQSNSCTMSVQVCAYDMGQNRLKNFPLVPVPSVGVNSGPWCEICTAKTYTCSPAGAAPEVCVACSRGQTAQAAKPIDMATGNTYITQSDLAIPGLGGGLSLARTWNSILPSAQNSYAFMFGTNWRSTYEERLIYNSSDGYLKYARSDGSVWSFGIASNGDWQNKYLAAAPSNDTTMVLQVQDQTTLAFSWTLTAANGEKRTFDSTSGALLSIIDRNGNTTQLAYDSSKRLTTVTDPVSRHLYFNYSGTGTLVNSVTSDVGITVSYLYDSQGRLTQVTRQDNTTISFAYDTQNRITSVTDANGKILESHTYDALGRGLTASRANGVDAVTVTYPQ
jgi:YD repeat-containing protein